jgi:hypothetical protein
MSEAPRRIRYRCEIMPKCKGDERCAKLPCPCGFWEKEFLYPGKENVDSGETEGKVDSLGGDA